MLSRFVSVGLIFQGYFYGIKGSFELFKEDYILFLHDCTLFEANNCSFVQLKKCWKKYAI